MTEERKFVDMEGMAVESYIEGLKKTERAYKMVFYGLMSPKELDGIAIKLEGSKPETQEEKREFKLAELNAYKREYLEVYNELCGFGVVEPNFSYLMENGFGLGAGDLFDDEDVDKLIAQDEQIEQAKLRGKTAE